MDVMFVYVTAGDAAEARRIGRAVVEERLAACANIIDKMTSIYWWDGKVQEAGEAVLILKTTEGRLAMLVERVQALHSYDCPTTGACVALRKALYRPVSAAPVTNSTEGRGEG